MHYPVPCQARNFCFIEHKERNLDSVSSLPFAIALRTRWPLWNTILVANFAFLLLPKICKKRKQEVVYFLHPSLSPSFPP